ncbi:hypothetical protein [Paenibacillus sp. GXUN7292]|uniref:hypothetical protein n=1 Tax=Paenibacillus sp. GXUN7292 TaxID=3422499 RepID=UPI003D7DCEB9
MPFIIHPARFEKNHDAYLRFLLQHHDKLGLPYPFGMKLSLISSPLILGQVLLVFEEDPYELVGAFGIVHGTSEQEYADPQICQIEVCYLAAASRKTRLFSKCLSSLIDLIQNKHPDTTTLSFWISQEQYENDRLIAKCRNWSGATERFGNGVVQIRLPFDSVSSYISRLNN